MRRGRAWNRGSERRGSKSGIVLIGESHNLKLSCRLSHFLWSKNSGTSSAYPTYRTLFDTISGAVKTGEWYTLVDDFRTLPISQLLVDFP
jgi:hypothetical protein